MFSDDGFSGERKRVLIISKEADTKLSEVSRLLRLDKQFVVTQYEDLRSSRSYLHKGLPHVIVIASFGVNHEIFYDIKEFKRFAPFLKVLYIHLGHRDELPKDSAVELFRYGLDGFVVPGHDSLRITKAIEKVVSGERIIDDMVLGWVLESIRINENSDLTPRELEVLNLLCDGKTSSEIADNLCISRLTARAHIRNIYAKLNVSKKSQAIQVAKKERYIQ